MTCKELIAFIHDYLSGEISEEERARFEAHLDACPPCVAYLRGYEESVRLAKAAFAGPDEPVPEEVPEELVAAILAVRKERTT